MASRPFPETVHVWIVAEDPLVGGNLATALGQEENVAIAGQLAPSEVGAARGADPPSGGPGSRSSASGSPADALVWDLGPRSHRADVDVAFDTSVPVLALAAGPDDALAAVARGAAGAVRRDASPARVVAALRAVASGLVVLDRESAGALFRGRSSSTELASEPLTPRELEVLQLLAGGLANKEIARRLGISEHTVKFHVNAILTKLGAQGRTEAVVRAARLGLVVL